MSKFNDKHLPDELQHVVERLRTERPEATALELDEIKLRAMGRTKRAPGKGQFMRSKLLATLLSMGVLLGGAGAMAVTGGIPTTGGSGHSSGKKQYCPPKHRGDDDDDGGSHGKKHGKPKKHKRCKKGPKPGHGHNGNGNGHGDDDDDDGNGHGGKGSHFKWWYHGHWFWRW